MDACLSEDELGIGDCQTSLDFWRREGIRNRYHDASSQDDSKVDRNGDGCHWQIDSHTRAWIPT